MNDLVVVEELAEWEKLKTLVLDSVSSPAYPEGMACLTKRQGLYRMQTAGVGGGKGPNSKGQ